MRTKVLASSAAVLGFAATLAAQAPPALTEFQVNATTTDMQIAPSAASLGDTGNFVVTWTTKAGDLNYQVVARRFWSRPERTREMIRRTDSNQEDA